MSDPLWRVVLAEKMRVHILAKKLSVTSKAVLEKCRAEGLGGVVKNHMSALGAGLEATICEWFSEGAHSTAVETAERIDLEKVRVKPVEVEVVAPALAEPEASSVAVASEVAAQAVESSVAEAVAVGASATEIGQAIKPDSAQSEGAVAEAVGDILESVETPSEGAVESITDRPSGATSAPMIVGSEIESAAAPQAPTDPADTKADVDSQDGKVAAEAPETAVAKAPDRPEDVTPAGPQNIPAPAKITGPRHLARRPVLV